MRINPQNKYHAQRTEVDGITFDSKGEANRYRDLILLQKSGEIDSNIKLQPRFVLNVQGKKICEFRGDFLYREKSSAKWVVEDYKGFYTAISRLKHKLFMALFSEMTLRIVDAQGNVYVPGTRKASKQSKRAADIERRCVAEGDNGHSSYSPRQSKHKHILRRTR